ncbi:hypothetical protein PCASD_21997 [Puccinia coronata f. sp. avenae]|uniref:Uncharacterized protein n=1 Tax=Puccinia coronata f. sp. avenae TaxID=200324 RepID=A0A2N5SLM1_9BASI|nr:hypothetical protein PCASD_21997 [Puccinia coronata f. sp. avenae]
MSWSFRDAEHEPGVGMIPVSRAVFGFAAAHPGTAPQALTGTRRHWPRGQCHRLRASWLRGQLLSVTRIRTMSFFAGVLTRVP